VLQNFKNIDISSYIYFINYLPFARCLVASRGRNYLAQSLEYGLRHLRFSVSVPKLDKERLFELAKELASLFSLRFREIGPSHSQQSEPCVARSGLSQGRGVVQDVSTGLL